MSKEKKQPRKKSLQSPEDKKRQLNNRRPAAFLFIGMLTLLILIDLLVSDKTFSEKENRMLEQKPEMSWSTVQNGRFMDKYESYRTDQFAGRNLWVTVKTYMEFLMGKRDENGIFKGKQNYLLEEIEYPDMEQMEQNIEAMQAFQKEYKNIPAYIMLVPNAANILADKLPDYAVTEDQAKQFQEIKKLLGDGITWIDVEKVLKTNKKEEIYYHTDHHWTTLGAYYAYQELAKVLELDMEKSPALKPYAVTGNFNGTLSASSGYEGGYREPIYIYAAENSGEDIDVVVNYVDEQKKTATLYDKEKLKEKDKYGVFFGGNYGMVTIRTAVDSTERLLIFKDSYANCLIPFLTPYYREIIMIDPRYYYGDIRQVMKENHITGVLYLYNGNTFVKDSSISGVLADGEAE